MRYLRKIVLTILALPMLAAASYTVTDSGVVFIYRNPSARQVMLSGSFVNWDPNGIPMKQDSAGVFVAIVKLSPGTYQYKFIVDGVWTEDPDNPNKVDDGYGGFNSVAEVKSTVQKAQSGAKEGRAEFKYYNPDAREVYLTGDFADWDPKAIPMVRQPDGTWIARVDIPPGEHEYKFVVDGVWTADPLNPVTRGEFGNSVIIIKPDGTAQYPAGAQQLANSVASSRILFSGAVRAFMLTFRDRDLPGGYYGDGRWKLYRPLAKFDVNMRIHIAQGVTGFGSFDVNTFDADRLYEAHLRLDSAGVEIAPQSFTLNAFFNRQIAAPDDILGIVGGYRYAEPTFETPQKFGLGFGGIDFRTDFAGAFLRGTNLALVVANMYEDWTLEPDSLDFLNLFGRRPLGFWRRQVATAEPPTDFSNFGTDVVIFRVARDFGFIAPALNIRVDRNQWWLPTSEISYSRFDSIYDANGLHSDWVDLGALETGIAPEINIKPFDALELGGEYLLWQYRSSIDAGNRENH
ncbi:glycogen-binding domain-containing protein, partial [bacterium]|nr:glycogen-binding domain-containing protein [bacterium]